MSSNEEELPSLDHRHVQDIYMFILASGYIHAVIRELREPSQNEENHKLWILALKTALGAISWPEPPYSCDPEGPCDCLG